MWESPLLPPRFHEALVRDFPRGQIVTIEDPLAGREPDVPPMQ
jgi:hypothetical protein